MTQPGLLEKRPYHRIRESTLYIFGSAFLNSYSTVLFSNNRWLGLLLLLATLNTPFIGICGVIGTITAIITTRLLKFTTWEDKSGFYSFNGLLVSLGAAYFYPVLGIDYPLFFTIIIIGSIFAAILSVALSQYFKHQFALPALSLGFVIVVTLIYFIYIRIGKMPLMIIPHHLIVDWAPQVKGWFALYLKSMGSIFFQTNLLGGILIALVVLLHSRIAFALSLIGFAVGYVFLFAHTPFSETEFMLTGFNTILTAVAIGGIFFVPSILSFVIAAITGIAGALIGISVQSIFHSAGIPPLAIPFNFIVLVTLYAFKLRLKNFHPYLIDFYSSSPEASVDYYYSRISRFFGAGRPQFFLPFNGEWTVSQGPHDEPTHKLLWREAWDFEVLDEYGKSFKNAGAELNDYYCFDKPVLAPANGTVVKIVNWVEDNLIGHVNTHDNWGNLIVIQHQVGIFSLLSHLRKGSIKVKEGQYVVAGEIIAGCGNSGRSLVPHLHFHIQSTAEPGSHTLKTNLINYLIKNRDVPIFKRFGTPKKGDQLSALHPEYRLQEILHLKVKDTYSFKVTESAGRTFEENWQVNIDFWGNISIVSDRKARVWFSIYNGIFDVLKFEGNKNSALYALSIALPTFPYSEEKEFLWADRPPIYSVLPFYLKTVEEIFSFIFRPINYIGRYKALHEESGFVKIEGKVNLAVLKFGISELNSHCHIHPDKGITKLELTCQGKSKLQAEQIEVNQNNTNNTN